jgi:hypothetical protein
LLLRAAVGILSVLEVLLAFSICVGSNVLLTVIILLRVMQR